MLRLAGNDLGSFVPDPSLCGTSRPGMGHPARFWGQGKLPRSCTLIATVFRNLGVSSTRAHPSPSRARPRSRASISHNSRSDKHLNGFANEEGHLNSKRLESRACENCGGNLEDELLYNGWISCVRPRKDRKRVSSVIEETSHNHRRKAGYGSRGVPASALCRLCAAAAQRPLAVGKARFRLWQDPHRHS